ncbi:30S ribosomal protein S8 [bacterium]|nr:30S ribosomal protein S8 [bacterium]
MSMTDPVADYLTRIRNAAQAKHRKVDIPASTLKLEMTKILHEFKYIQNFIVIDDEKQGLIRIYLKYLEDESCVIRGLRRISKPGLRQYTGANKIPRVFNNMGMAIMTTPNGVISDRKARELHVGGEVLCYVW